MQSKIQRSFQIQLNILLLLINNKVKSLRADKKVRKGAKEVTMKKFFESCEKFYRAMDVNTLLALSIADRI